MTKYIQLLKTKTWRGQSRDTMPRFGRHQERFWTRKISAPSMVNMGRKPGLRNSIMVILEFCFPGQVRLGRHSLVFTKLPVHLLIHIMSVPRGGALGAGESPPLWNSKVQIRKQRAKKTSLETPQIQCTAIHTYSSAAWRVRSPIAGEQGLTSTLNKNFLNEKKLWI